jgi:hypothetical protein
LPDDRGSTVHLSTGPALTVKAHVALAVMPLLSVTVTVKFEVPAVPFRLPVTRPVLALIERPGGRFVEEYL